MDDYTPALYVLCGFGTIILIGTILAYVHDRLFPEDAP